MTIVSDRAPERVGRYNGLIARIKRRIPGFLLALCDSSAAFGRQKY